MASTSRLTAIEKNPDGHHVAAGIRQTAAEHVPEFIVAGTLVHRRRVTSTAATASAAACGATATVLVPSGALGRSRDRLLDHDGGSRRRVLASALASVLASGLASATSVLTSALAFSRRNGSTDAGSACPDVSGLGFARSSFSLGKFDVPNLRHANAADQTTGEAELSWPCSLLLRHADLSANSRRCLDDDPSPTFENLSCSCNISKTACPVDANAACSPSGLTAPN